MFKHQLSQIPIKKFKQNLPLLTIDLPASESVTVMLLANTGSRYEPKNKEGIAHFFEHMVFKGTANYPDAKDLARALDSVGADFNAFTSKEYTGYYVRSASTNFDLSLDILSDMLLLPKLRQSDIDREKGVIIEELNMYVDTPSQHIANVFEQMLFADPQLSHDIIGTKKSIRSMTTADFQGFLGKYYGPENLLLVVAGGLDKIHADRQQLLNKIALAFNKLDHKRGTGAKCQVPLFEPAKNATSTQQINQKAFSTEKFKLIQRESEQAHFVMAWPALHGRSEDRYVLSVLSTILGGNMSARLFAEVREKRGLCYYIHSDMDSYHDSGYFGASAGVDPKRVEEAIRATKAVFLNLVNGIGQAGEQGLISAEELLRAQSYLKGKILLGLESSQRLAEFYGFKELLNDEIMSPDEVLAKIEAVTLKDLARVAKLIFKPEELRFAMIGNFKNEAEIQSWVNA